jgi:hypothetical protein
MTIIRSWWNERLSFRADTSVHIIATIITMGLISWRLEEDIATAPVAGMNCSAADGSWSASREDRTIRRRDRFASGFAIAIRTYPILSRTGYKPVSFRRTLTDWISVPQSASGFAISESLESGLGRHGRGLGITSRAFSRAERIFITQMRITGYRY